LPLVCITGDIHHNLGIFEEGVRTLKVEHMRSELRNSEYLCAREYSEIAEDYATKVTLFVTGKCIEKHESFWESLSCKKHVELGGHMYAVMPIHFHMLFKKLFNSYYGPYFYQEMDIKKTLQAFDRIGVRPRSWRTHGYWGNETTYKILGKYGFKAVSDLINIGDLQVKKVNGIGDLKHIPINIPPNGQIFKYYLQKNPQKIKKMGKKIRESILEGIKKKRDLVIQLHPICQKLLDNYETFKVILKNLSESNYLSLTITELADNFL
jgi:peptidoglycan/xylan/chitin deacetylase (PgdA/CDA1 family)